MIHLLPEALYRRVHAPMPFLSNLEAFPKMAASLGLGPESFASLVDPRFPSAAYALAGGDAELETAVVVMNVPIGSQPSPRDRHVLDCFAAHLGSALRLRSHFGGRPNADDDAVEAVFGPDGKVLDLRGGATTNVEDRIESLIDAVRRSEHAKLRGATDEERLDLATALLDGRWSVLESTERDGKRLLLACRNDPRGKAVRTLSERERAIVSYALLGHSFKYIAYELGIAISTVSKELKTALRKLGLRSRAELVDLFSRVREAVP
jgi:DNA-binding CsgD family transcriptional regulator